MSSGYYWFWLAEFCIGALVGVCAVKQTPMRGLAISLLLGWAGVVELIVVSIPKNRIDISLVSLVGHVVGVMGFGFLLWVFSLLFACVGYWLAFWISRRLGVGGGWQFSIPALFALVAIYAAVAAIGRMM
jgi:hypothetical protein